MGLITANSNWNWNPPAPRSQSPAASATFGVDGGDALGGAHVPDADGLVAGRCDEEVRVGGMPAELVHAVAVASVVVLLHLPADEEEGRQTQVKGQRCATTVEETFEKETATSNGYICHSPS